MNEMFARDFLVRWDIHVAQKNLMGHPTRILHI
jgi:hypothetical protein